MLCYWLNRFSKSVGQCCTEQSRMDFGLVAGVLHRRFMLTSWTDTPRKYFAFFLNFTETVQVTGRRVFLSYSGGLTCWSPISCPFLGMLLPVICSLWRNYGTCSRCCIVPVRIFSAFILCPSIAFLLPRWATVSFNRPSYSAVQPNWALWKLNLYILKDAEFHSFVVESFSCLTATTCLRMLEQWDSFKEEVKNYAIENSTVRSFYAKLESAHSSVTSINFTNQKVSILALFWMKLTSSDHSCSITTTSGFVMLQCANAVTASHPLKIRLVSQWLMRALPQRSKKYLSFSIMTNWSEIRMQSCGRLKSTTNIFLVTLTVKPRWTWQSPEFLLCLDWAIVTVSCSVGH